MSESSRMPLRDQLGSGRPRPVRRQRDVRIPVLVTILVALTVGGASLYVKAQSHAYRTSPETLCRTDALPSEINVVLLDMSDQFTEPQLLQIGNELDRLLTSVAQFGLIEAYSVGSVDHGVIRPVIHLCKPETGTDMSAVYQNPELARKRWETFATR